MPIALAWIPHRQLFFWIGESVETEITGLTTIQRQKTQHSKQQFIWEQGGPALKASTRTAWWCQAAECDWFCQWSRGRFNDTMRPYLFDCLEPPYPRSSHWRGWFNRWPFGFKRLEMGRYESLPILPQGQTCPHSSSQKNPYNLQVHWSGLWKHGWKS